MPRKKPVHHESRIQKSCVSWFRYQYPKHILFAIPNGGKRGIIEASIMKAEGTLKGVPDLFLAHTKYGADGGLFIELKAPGAYPTPEQRMMHGSLTAAGYRVVVCRSLEEFMKEVNDYIAS